MQMFVYTARCLQNYIRFKTLLILAHRAYVQTYTRRIDSRYAIFEPFQYKFLIYFYFLSVFFET